MKIKDSGERRHFSSGAVRDIVKGKGRCDLLPLRVISALSGDEILLLIEKYKDTGDTANLFRIITDFSNEVFGNTYEMALEVAKQFEGGADKYGEDNWKKGIPTQCYIDSATRHYLKYRSGWTDEPHDRAFMWNLICCLWTVYNNPDFCSYNERKDL